MQRIAETRYRCNRLYIPKAEFYLYLNRLVDGFSNRIMLGSDQMQWPQSISTAIETIQSADFLTDQQKRDIFIIMLYDFSDYKNNNKTV